MDQKCERSYYIKQKLQHSLYLRVGRGDQPVAEHFLNIVWAYKHKSKKENQQVVR